jgi:hypothetical protein
MPKPADALSISASECLSPATGGESMLCRCGDWMNLDRTIPKLGVCPELRVFVCPSCKEVEAKEASVASRSC